MLSSTLPATAVSRRPSGLNAIDIVNFCSELPSTVMFVKQVRSSVPIDEERRQFLAGTEPVK